MITRTPPSPSAHAVPDSNLVLRPGVLRLATGVPHGAERTMRRERGMVTAEVMTIAPLGVAFAFLLLWIVSLGLTEVRLADASREAARMLARGESTDSATAMARRHAPGRASVDVSRDEGTVTVTVTTRSSMPLPFFAGIGSRTLGSTSVAASEQP